MSDPTNTSSDAHRTKLINALVENLNAERRSAATYRFFADCETDPHRKQILGRLADAEERHADNWRVRLRELGAEPREDPVSIPRVVRMRAKTDLNAALREAETIENDHLQHYEAKRSRLTTPDRLRRCERSRRRRASTPPRCADSLPSPPGTQHHALGLDSLLKGERHVSSGTWIADAIYGANDGLGAVFGLVAGVAGGAASSHFIFLAGIAGAVASAVSMGSGAYLAAKSEREVHEAEMARERREITEDPEEEREELSLFYQLKGLTEDEANMLAERISRDEEQFLKVLASEELGLSEERLPKPLIVSFFGNDLDRHWRDHPGSSVLLHRCGTRP